MNFATAETTNLFLLVLTIIAVVQFGALIVVLLQVKAAMTKVRSAVSVIETHDLLGLQRRLAQLLHDVETLVSRGNNVVGAVERGAQDLGAAASAVGQTAQTALAISSFKAQALTSAVKTGLDAFLRGRPWIRPRLAATTRPPVHPSAHLN